MEGEDAGSTLTPVERAAPRGAGGRAADLTAPLERGIAGGGVGGGQGSSSPSSSKDSYSLEPPPPFAIFRCSTDLTGHKHKANRKRHITKLVVFTHITLPVLETACNISMRQPPRTHRGKSNRLRHWSQSDRQKPNMQPIRNKQHPDTTVPNNKQRKNTSDRTSVARPFFSPEPHASQVAESVHTYIELLYRARWRSLS